MSFLGVFLEWVFEIRTGNDLIRALPADFPDRAVLKTAVDDLEKKTKFRAAWRERVNGSQVFPYALPSHPNPPSKALCLVILSDGLTAPVTFLNGLTAPH